GGGGSPKSAATHPTTHHHKTHKAKTHTTQTNTTQASTTTPPATTPSATQSSPSAMNDQGKALIDAGRPADAIPILQQALAAFPASERSSLVYGYTLFNLGDAYLKS